MVVKIRRARQRDAVKVFHNLRFEDEQEVLTSLPFNADMQEVLLGGWKQSAVSYAITVDGTTVAVMGLLTTRAGVSVVWMLCTDDVRLAPKAVLLRCRDIAAKWYRRYGLLLCICDNRNALHLRWLNIIGFTKQGELVQKGKPFTRLLYKGGISFARHSSSRVRP